MQDTTRIQGEVSTLIAAVSERTAVAGRGERRGGGVEAGVMVGRRTEELFEETRRSPGKGIHFEPCLSTYTHDFIIIPITLLQRLDFYIVQIHFAG